jgi:capsular exopolysaccharide synthesis family protein
MELREAVATLRAAWAVPVLAAILAGGAALLVSLLLTPQYRSSTQLFVSAAEPVLLSQPYQGSQLARDRVPSYTELIQGTDFARHLVDRLNLRMSPAELHQEIEATAVTDTVLIDVTITDPQPQRALAIANAVGPEFAAQAALLEMTAGGTSAIHVTVSEQPQLAARPSFPQTWRNVLVAAIFGLLLGAVVALMRPVLDRSVKSPDEAADLTGAPVLGVVPENKKLKKGNQSAVVHLGDRDLQEGYRRIRVNLQLLDPGRSPCVIMVSSAVSAEGKSTVVLNLGIELAKAGHKVIVAEANFWSPGFARQLGIRGDVGLAQVLTGAVDVIDAIRPCALSSLSVLPAGSAPPDPAQLLASRQLRPVLESLRENYDFVLVEGPPLLTVAYSSELALDTDGVLLAVRFGRTRKAQLEEAAAMVEFAQCRRVMGVVLTMMPGSRSAIIGLRRGGHLRPRT